MDFPTVLRTRNLDKLVALVSSLVGINMQLGFWCSPIIVTNLNFFDFIRFRCHLNESGWPSDAVHFASSKSICWHLRNTSLEGSVWGSRGLWLDSDRLWRDLPGRLGRVTAATLAEEAPHSCSVPALPPGSGRPGVSSANAVYLWKVSSPGCPHTPPDSLCGNT